MEAQCRGTLRVLLPAPCCGGEYVLVRLFRRAGGDLVSVAHFPSNLPLVGSLRRNRHGLALLTLQQIRPHAAKPGSSRANCPRMNGFAGRLQSRPVVKVRLWVLTLRSR